MKGGMPMYDKEEMRFCGKAMSIAESEFGGSFKRGKEGDALQEGLWKEYVKAGKPKLVEWLRNRLPTMFKCDQERPNWHGAIPEWQYLNGVPMTFIKQFNTSNSEIAKEA